MDHTKHEDKICEACGQALKFIRMRSGKWMPVDATMFVAQKADPAMRLVQSDGTIKTGVEPGDAGYISHFATCHDPGRFRK
jgi:hypothetical protein